MSYARTRSLDPEFIKLVVPLLPPPNTDPNAPLDVKKSRAAMAAMTAAKERALNGPWRYLLDDISIQNIQILMRDGHKAELRVIKPKNMSTTLPVYYSLHGGGFIGGNNDTEELINRQLAREGQLVIFSLDYRLVPEYDLLTTVFEDCEDGAKWVVEHASEHGGDPKQGFFIGGTSSGATLASMLCYRASSLNLPVKGMLLRQGVFFPQHFAKDEWKPRLKSMEENADSPLLNANDCNRLSKISLDVPEKQARDPWYFPVFGTRQQLSRMPRAYIVGAGCDPMVDQVTLFNGLLEDAGVETRIKNYEGMPHGFHAFHSLPQALAEMKETAAGVSWLITSTN